MHHTTASDTDGYPNDQVVLPAEQIERLTNYLAIQAARGDYPEIVVTGPIPTGPATVAAVARAFAGLDAARFRTLAYTICVVLRSFPPRDIMDYPTMCDLLRFALF